MKRRICFFNKTQSYKTATFYLIASVVLIGLVVSGCTTPNNGKTSTGPTQSTAPKTTTEKKGPTGESAGLTAVEAAQLVYGQAQKNFGDAVLFRMAPVSDKDATDLKLPADWQKTGRATDWFIWYADADGENWLMFSISGKKLADYDIGTRDWSVMSMGSDWPREKPAVTLDEAAAAAAEQGANLDELTWVEMACDYPAGDFGKKPVWVFACSETTDEGLTLNYRIFIDAIKGDAAGALNDRNERIELPIDLAAMGKPRDENHQADLEAFFDLVIKQDWTFAISQLSYQLAPDDNARQMWQDNFKSLDTLKVISIEQANLVQWTDDWECYQVVLDVKTSEPIEKFGWENGENTRWVSIIPQGAGNWKIGSFSSSP